MSLDVGAAAPIGGAAAVGRGFARNGVALAGAQEEKVVSFMVRRVAEHGGRRL